MEKMVSIVVPVYNAEKYLKECLDSILNQEYRNIEVVIVNDGSTDHSEEICRRVAEHDDRIRLISTVNGGSSAARNIGLDECRGDFIAFVDADDTIDSSFLKKLVNLLEKEKADIALCDFDGLGNPHGNWEDSVLVGQDIYEAYVTGGIFSRIMNKVYPREIIGNIRFPLGRNYMEDAVWTSQVLSNVKKIVRSSEKLYHYRIVNNSLSHLGKKNEEVLCGRFRNELDYFHSVFLNIKKAEIRKIVYDKYIQKLFEFFESGCNLEIWDVYTVCRQITKSLMPEISKYGENIAQKLITDIIVGDNYAQVSLRHCRRILISPTIPLKRKIKLIYNNTYKKRKN